MVHEIASRFRTAVSERVAASALPFIGALSGATVNLMFMSHFQQIAEGHFTVRRLETPLRQRSGTKSVSIDCV